MLFLLQTDQTIYPPWGHFYSADTLQLLSAHFIKTASENPVLWTGMKGASAESRKNRSDAETSSA